MCGISVGGGIAINFTLNYPENVCALIPVDPFLTGYTWPGNAPLLMKLGVQLGLDPIHLGTIVVINFAVGMETPPLGYSLFVASAISGLSIEEIAKGMLPFFLVDFGMLMLITFVPWMSLWLPTLVFG